MRAGASMIRAAARLLLPAALAGPACAAAGPAACAPVAHDWMSAEPPTARRIAPSHCAAIDNSTPAFFWARPRAAVYFDWTIERLDGSGTRHRRTVENWLLADEALPPGDYRWRVAVRIDAAVRESSWRRFTVRPDAAPSLAGPLSSWPARAGAAPRPRSWPRGSALAALREEAASGRARGLRALQARVRGHMAAALPLEPAAPAGGFAQPPAAQADAYGAWAAWLTATGTAVAREQSRIEDALAAWMLTGNEDYWREALRRVGHLAEWDPHGSTSHAAQDQANRAIMRLIAELIDCGFDRLSEAERERFAAVVRSRWTQAYQAVIGGGALRTMPFDSHGVSTAGALAAVALLMAGVDAAADDWIAQTVPLYLALLSPWGGEDGGYANGVAYARHDLRMMLFNVDVLSGALGVDLSRHDWFSHLGEFLVHMSPPGAVASAFGDEVEQPAPGYTSLLVRALAGRIPSSLLAWYAEASSPPDPSDPLMLRTPAPRAPALEADRLPASRLFASIGVAAMHDSLAAADRVSVYFRSSPYGSFNHGHADQNSFVITRAGRPLAIDSGYYDYYRSPHFLAWYKQTQAHNAITFDGGRGQAIGPVGNGEMAATGAIVSFRSTPQWDAVAGDAARAYGAPVERALRTLVFVRPGTVVVVDRLAASRALRWEWNLHTEEALSVVPASSAAAVGLVDSGHALCAHVEADAPLVPAMRTGFPAPPAGRSLGAPDQHHARLSLAAPAASARFVAVLRVGCTGSEPRIAYEAAGDIRIEVAGRTVEVGDSAVAVR